MSAATKPTTLSSQNHHIATRFSHGVNEELIRDIGSKRNAADWFEKQLVPSRFSDARADAVRSWFPGLSDSPSVAWAKVNAQETSAWQYGFDFTSYTVARKLLTRRQVHDVMADFWSNLLYIPAGENRSFPWRMDYDRAIRARSLNSFRTLLRAAVVHPAMSGWLNNSSNTKEGINENLGRELLELFTVGRPAGYDEEDVKNSARLLTGYRVKEFDGYAATYDPGAHWTGPVKVLGFSHPNTNPDGQAAVMAYLDYLARHPATAERIARRLCVRFVSDTPSPSIVTAVSKAYRRSDTDIRTTLRTLVKHPEFLAARRTKMRTPVEDVVAAARALGMRPTGSSSDSSFVRHVQWMAGDMGQLPFSWPRPDGFPETSATWGSPARVLRSWDLNWSLAGNWWKSTELYRPKADTQLPTSWPRSLDDLVEHQSRMLLGRPSTPQMRQAAAGVLEISTSKSYPRASSVPDWAWIVIRATVLNHPHGMLR